MKEVGRGMWARAWRRAGRGDVGRLTRKLAELGVRASSPLRLKPALLSSDNLPGARTRLEGEIRVGETKRRRRSAEDTGEHDGHLAGSIRGALSMARRRDSDVGEGLGCLFSIVFIGVVIFGDYINWYAVGAIIVLIVVALIALMAYRRKKAEAAVRRERENRERAIRQVMGRDTTAEAVHYMSGVEFERFMANFLAMQGYGVKTTKASGDQGVDLLLTGPGGRRVAAQLKRYTRPVGNKAVQEVFAGRFHYKAEEAWVIATTSFTKGAYEAARSTGVRLIDGDELAEWLREAGEDLRAKDRPEVDPPSDRPDREDRGVWHPHPDDPGGEGR